MTTTLSDPLLEQGYRECARLTKAYGTTYYWGALMLAPERRRHVYAVYALCRLADDIVDGGTDEPAPDADVAAGRLAGFVEQFERALAGNGSADPVLAAVVRTVGETGIDAACFDRFFGAMAMDLTVTGYRTFADLCGYMEGSAAVIGEMMLPVLEPLSPEAIGPARSLGFAFQLTNFLRDVVEDHGLGRCYLPLDEVAEFGVDLDERRVTPQWRAFMAFQIERNRRLYRHADLGIPMLPPRSAKCVAAARLLYSRILDRIEQADYNVFEGRIRVPTWRKAAAAGMVFIAGPTAHDR